MNQPKKNLNKLLIVEDDATFAAGLVRAFSRRDFVCQIVDSNGDALEAAQYFKPTHILMDLNLGEETTEEIIQTLRKRLPRVRLVILTGHGTIPSTVRAIRDGADEYLCKPANIEKIEAALCQGESVNGLSSLGEVEEQHILRVLENCGGNISQAAQVLGLHRRTLQRKMKNI